MINNICEQLKKIKSAHAFKGPQHPWLLLFDSTSQHGDFNPCETVYIDQFGRFLCGAMVISLVYWPTGLESEYNRHICFYE